MKFFKTISCSIFLLALCLCSVAQNSYEKTGLASFYADNFEGRRTSSGEIFSQSKMTCAHRTLPLGTKLRVTNLENTKTVIVVVNDRGPFIKSRIVDLSKAAAKKLDFIKAGETEVIIEVLNSEPKADTLFLTTDTLMPFYKVEPLKEGVKGFSIKVASFLSEERTFEVVRELQHKTGQEVFVQQVWHKKHFMYRVFAGKFIHRDEAEKLKASIKEQYPDCYITQLTNE